jgi:hypothetical protein
MPATRRRSYRLPSVNDLKDALQAWIVLRYPSKNESLRDQCVMMQGPPHSLRCFCAILGLGSDETPRISYGFVAFK